MSEVFDNLTGMFRAKGPLLLPGLAISSVTVTVGAGGTYAPDLKAAIEHNVNALGDITIGIPAQYALPSGFSHLFLLHLRNASGGAITVTFNAVYHQSAFVPPANGSGVIMLWHHDEDTGVWYCSAKQTVAT
jgi:hypothetical protein